MIKYMQIKAIHIIQKDYADEEDFFMECEVFIGPEDEEYAYEAYDYKVISLKRLTERFNDDDVMLNRGWMIVKYYEESEIRNKINGIIRRCTVKDEEDTYRNIGSFLIRQDQEF
ncbi:MAG: hypothetical protein IJ736_10375 [Firmicutes bacterium]|nr:hypothetical protein [Bacillota bacterium]